MLSVLTLMICKTDNRTDLFQRYFSHIVATCNCIVTDTVGSDVLCSGIRAWHVATVRPFLSVEYYRICVILRVTETWKGSVTDYEFEFTSVQQSLC